MPTTLLVHGVAAPGRSSRTTSLGIIGGSCMVQVKAAVATIIVTRDCDACGRDRLRLVAVATALAPRIHAISLSLLLVPVAL